MRTAEPGFDRAKALGLAGWLLARLRRESRPRPRLVLLERISIAPRQSLALVEAEGHRFLVATSAEGTPAFQALDERTGFAMNRKSLTQPRVRASW